MKKSLKKPKNKEKKVEFEVVGIDDELDCIECDEDDIES